MPDSIGVLPRPDGPLEQAAEAIARAHALIATSGAGMGVDSGLPDYRGTEGFWQAYPPLAEAGISYESVSAPKWLQLDPTRIWGFLGHCLELYRATVPHEGFSILRRWGERARQGCFVVTSNVDSHFQRAGFDEARIMEGHGSLAWMQCSRSCGIGIFSAEGVRVDVDRQTMRSRGPLPSCRRCGAAARPNVLMFGDCDFDPTRAREQEARFEAWRSSLRGPVTEVECGAGTGIPNVRRFSEKQVAELGATLVRINPREPEVPNGQIGIRMGALEALRRLDSRLPR